ncbi:MAG: ROK family protein [Parachlamydiaceae bacterium]
MPNLDLRYAIGVDLGGTKIEMGVVDATGHILDGMRLHTEVEDGPIAVQERLIKGIHALQSGTGVPLSGIGIGVAGQIELNSGSVTFAPNLKWNNIPLKANIEKIVQIPVGIFNDVRAIALGEWLYGAGKGYQDILCVFIGTGIGAGIVSGGRLMTGSSNTFGEVGHMTIDLNGPICTCGKQGCFEAIAGGWGIAARAQEAIQTDKSGSRSQCLLEIARGNINEVNAKTVVEGYRRGDSMAKEVIHHMQKALIHGLASLVNLYNPSRLILGGGLVDGIPEIVSMIEKGIREISLQAATQSMDVVKGRLGKEVGVVGSAAAIFHLLNQSEGALE